MTAGVRGADLIDRHRAENGRRREKNVVIAPLR